MVNPGGPGQGVLSGASLATRARCGPNLCLQCCCFRIPSAGDGEILARKRQQAQSAMAGAAGACLRGANSTVFLSSREMALDTVACCDFSGKNPFSMHIHFVICRRIAIRQKVHELSICTPAGACHCAVRLMNVYEHVAIRKSLGCGGSYNALTQHLCSQNKYEKQHVAYQQD